MPLLFDRGRLIEECGDALAVLDGLDRGDRHDMADALDALRFAHETRVCHSQAKEARKGFDARYPAAAAPLAAFDRIRGRVVRRGPDHWLDPSRWMALKVLAAKAAELRAAIEGKPSATDWLTGSLTDLGFAIGLGKSRRSKKVFKELEAKGAIEFRSIENGVGWAKYQVRYVDDPERHRKAKERLATRTAKRG